MVGGGIVGLAAADALARRGADVVVLERFTPGSGQSAGAARGFRHLHATAEQIAEAVRARALWDAWSARAGEPLIGEEGALRLGGDVAGDVARLRAAGVEAAALEHAGQRRHELLGVGGRTSERLRRGHDLERLAVRPQQARRGGRRRGVHAEHVHSTVTRLRSPPRCDSLTRAAGRSTSGRAISGHSTKAIRSGVR